MNDHEVRKGFLFCSPPFLFFFLMCDENYNDSMNSGVSYLFLNVSIVCIVTVMDETFSCYFDSVEISGIFVCFLSTGSRILVQCQRSWFRHIFLVMGFLINRS